MGADRPVKITLTEAQVARVLRETSGGGLVELLAGVGDSRGLNGAVRPLLEEPGRSRSTLRALLVLGSFPADGTGRELSEVARQLDLSPSTTHRYAATWMAVGLLEQDPISRKYRRPTAQTEL